MVFDTHNNLLLSLNEATAMVAGAGGTAADAVTADTTAPPPTPIDRLDALTPLDAFAPEDAAPSSVEPGEGEAAAPGKESPLAPRLSSRAIVIALAILVLAQAAALLVVLRRGAAPAAAATAPAPEPAVRPAPANTGTPSEVPAPAGVPPVTPERPAPSAPAEQPQAVAPSPREGTLVVRSTPPGATIVVNGRRRGSAPVTVAGLAPGSYEVVAESGAVSIGRKVAVQGGGTTSLVLALDTPGQVHVISPIELQVFEDNRPLGTSSGSLRTIAPGPHRLVLKNEALGYEAAVDVTVAAGDTTELRPAIPDGVLQVNALPWATVSVDGRVVGDTPLGNVRVPLGSHQVSFQHPEHGQQVREVVVTARTPTRISVDMR